MNRVAERDGWIFLNQIPSLTPNRFHRLLKAAGSAEAILRMSIEGLETAVGSRTEAQDLRNAFRDSDLWNAAEEENRRAERGEICIVTELDDAYPTVLRELIGRPPVLYIKGRWPLPDRLAFGIVGTRHPSLYGLSAAERLTFDLAHGGATIISGLAAGIDAKAHETTLKSDGLTAAVLGHGLGHRYPPQNGHLFKEIAKKGALISEFPYNRPPLAIHFPRRNRIISGLSGGIVVIEAGLRSGALITARFAAEQGREVFAVPGSIFNATSAGCHRLLKEGAKLVESVEDILEEYSQNRGVLCANVMPKTRENDRAMNLQNLTELEQQIIDRFTGAPVSVEELTESMRIPVDQLAGALLSLELKEFIKRLPGQRYVTQH